MSCPGLTSAAKQHPTPSAACLPCADRYALLTPLGSSSSPSNENNVRALAFLPRRKLISGRIFFPCGPSAPQGGAHGTELAAALLRAKGPGKRGTSRPVQGESLVARSPQRACIPGLDLTSCFDRQREACHLLGQANGAVLLQWPSLRGIYRLVRGPLSRRPCRGIRILPVWEDSPVAFDPWLRQDFPQ